MHAARSTAKSIRMQLKLQRKQMPATYRNFDNHASKYQLTISPYPSPLPRPVHSLSIFSYIYTYVCQPTGMRLQRIANQARHVLELELKTPWDIARCRRQQTVQTGEGCSVSLGSENGNANNIEYGMEDSGVFVASRYHWRLLLCLP